MFISGGSGQFPKTTAKAETVNVVAKRKRGFKKTLFSHLRRTTVQIVDQLFGNIFVYLILGVINRIIGLFGERPIRSNFIFYAPNKRYLRTMVYDWYVPFVRWKPGLGQIMYQNGFWTLSFGIASNDEDFYNPENERKLKKTLRRAEFVAKIIGAKYLTFAGILPGVFSKYGFERKMMPVEKENTVTAVTQSVYITIMKEGLRKDVPVIVLGGSGYIGEGVVSALREQGYPGQIYPIDTKKGDISGSLPPELEFQSVIVLNITKKFAIKDYIKNLWFGAVIINEVFPEPSENSIAEMNSAGIVCYHITGVEAKAYPSMGEAYSGGIPCCASIKPKEGEGEYKVLTKRLTA